MRFISSKSKNQMRHGQGSRIQSQLNLPSQSRRRVNEADNTSKQVGLSERPNGDNKVERLIIQGLELIDLKKYREEGDSHLFG